MAFISASSPTPLSPYTPTPSTPLPDARGSAGQEVAEHRTDGARGVDDQVVETELAGDLLDASQVSVERLDALLRSSRDELDAGFFAHLEWEVEEQRKQKNRKVLDILEVVVQRACVEVEAGQPEVALLSAVLQTSNRLARAEMYQRELVRASGGKRVAAAFLSLVKETQLELEKSVLRGEQVDSTLLQMLRVVAVEGAEYADEEVA